MKEGKQRGSRGLCQHVVALVSPRKVAFSLRSVELPFAWAGARPRLLPTIVTYHGDFQQDGVSCTSCCSRWQGPAVGQAEFGSHQIWLGSWDLHDHLMPAQLSGGTVRRALQFLFCLLQQSFINPLPYVLCIVYLCGLQYFHGLQYPRSRWLTIDITILLS